MIILFDDEKNVRDSFKKELAGQAVNLEIIESDSKKDLKEKLESPELMKEVKALIFDLSTSKEEAETGVFEVLDYVKRNYDNYAIPIFIHSAFSHLVDGYENLGTVFKIKKDANSIIEIVTKIKLFYDCGFLEIFCPSGYLEREIHKEIHKAFNSQFLGEEVKGILDSIQHSKPMNIKERTKDIFARIAIRSLYQNLISAKRQPDSDKIEEIRINAVEHYYRRTSDFPVWTGDIFLNTQDHSQIVILTPRCDINNGVCKDRYLVCQIDKLDSEIIKKMSGDVNKYLTDNPQASGIKNRFLVPAPNYNGGKVDLTNYFIVPLDHFASKSPKYKYLVSLSDELTNEVVRKFSSYILRGGISASDITEATFYSKNNVL